jgi:hypothetical protein
MSPIRLQIFGIATLKLSLIYHLRILILQINITLKKTLSP